MSEIEVRPARAEDREAVLAFCADTWEGGDYIAAVWDEWLADTGGALLVGTLDGRPVGLIHLRRFAADEAWLEGIRVDPAVRGRGIGRRLTLRALSAARERGATVARLFTDSSNTAAQRLVAALGFEQIAAFARYVAPATAAEDGATALAGATVRASDVGELERLWAFLERSNLVPLNGGLVMEGWAAQALTTTVLEQALAAGDVYVLEAWEAIQALAIVRSLPDAAPGPRLVVRYLDGTTEGVGRLALALRGVAATRGLAMVRSSMPEGLMLHDAMEGAGYTRRGDGALWCYAHRL
jgi:ribosomal protein S18 acetylase RimI-like enzyme